MHSDSLLEDSSGKHIALFGGAFDPVHTGHQAVAHYLLTAELVDELWWVPTGNHPWDKKTAPVADRLALLNLILQPKQQINTWEIEQTEKNHTYLTLRYFRDQYPDTRFSFILGADSARTLFQWPEPKEMVTNHTFMVYPRQGVVPEQLDSRLLYLDDAPLVAISSTAVRERLWAGQTIDDLVDPQVAQYISEHTLYSVPPEKT